MIYLSEYIGSGTSRDKFRPRGSEQDGWAAFDLRPDGGATLEGGGLNACLLYVPERFTDSKVTLLGEHPNEIVPLKWARHLNCDLPASTLNDALLTLGMVPPAKGWKPIREPSLSLGPVPICLAGMGALTTIDRPIARRKFLTGLGIAGLVLGMAGLWNETASAALPATDNFNRANGALGSNWTQVTSESDWSITSNTINCNPATDAGHWWNADVFPNDQYSQMLLVALVGGSASGGQGAGTGVRIANGARTYYRSIINAAVSNNIDITKAVAGAFTSLGFRSQTLAANGTFYISVVGTVITIKWNGVAVGATATDSAITAGSAGLSFSSTVTSFTADDWEGGSAGSVTVPSVFRRRSM